MSIEKYEENFTKSLYLHIKLLVLFGTLHLLNIMIQYTGIANHIGYFDITLIPLGIISLHWVLGIIYGCINIGQVNNLKERIHEEQE